MTVQRLLALLDVELPIVQAPMAGAHDEELAIAVANAGGLGSLPCAMLTPEQIAAQVKAFRARAAKPVNLNFFCHRAPLEDAQREARFRALLEPYYRELGLDSNCAATGPLRQPFDETLCGVVEQLAPEIVSFHFGLPETKLLERVKRSGAKVLSSATSVAEARYLAERGCDAIIAQGSEAGGHRGMFLSEDPAAQVGTFALVPQIVDAVHVPVIAAGGIADGRGVAAALALGASGVQVGTVYLRSTEATITSLHRAALAQSRDDATRITNVLTGRPARGLATRLVLELGPLCADAPDFPSAAGPIAMLRKAAEARGSSDFSPLWAGQAAALAREGSAREITKALVDEADDVLRGLSIARVR
jgi:nitronate monooxygenase